MERRPVVVVLLVVLSVVGQACLVAGLAVAVSTRLDTSATVPATLASLGSWAWVALLTGAVLLAVCALVAHAPWGRLAWAVVGVAVVALAVQVVWLAPRFVAAPAGASGDPLVVMNANLQYGEGDAHSVVRAVRERRVDVLALEEVTPTELGRLGAAGLDRLLPSRVGRPASDDSGTVVLSRYELGEAASIGVSRGGLAVEVAAPRPFRLLAVHASDPLFSTEAWYADLSRVQAAARAAAEQGPVVVAGDLNTTLDHAPLRRLLRETGLRDAAEQAGSGLVPTWPGDRGVPVLTIDHVLSSREHVATSTRRVEVPGSDHLALVATLGSPP